MRRPYRKGGELGMEEENALGLQSTELGLACLTNELPLPTCLEAAHHELTCSEAGKGVRVSGFLHSRGESARSWPFCGLYHGPQFTAKAVHHWLQQLGVRTLFMDLGSLREKGHFAFLLVIRKQSARL